jgi:hypothetical protein
MKTMVLMARVAGRRLPWMATAVLVCAAANAAHFQSKCSYSDSARSVYFDGPCTLDSTEIQGHFAWIVTLKGGVKVTVEYVDQNGPDHIWKINGQPGWGFEITRRQLHGATLDLKQSISWEE